MCIRDRPADVLKGTISVSGTTVTIPKNDGTTYNITTQDTNTQYSASDFNITNLAGFSNAAYANSNVITGTANKAVHAWTSLSNAGFAPSTTFFDFVVTFKNGSGTTVSVAKWRATRDTSNNVVLDQGITNNDSGSGTTSSKSGQGSALMSVTFSNGGASVTVAASLTLFTGFTFKSQ